MKPLVIVKINGHHDKEDEENIISDIQAGFDRGQLILSGDCAVIAFDEEGRMVYPIRKEATS